MISLQRAAREFGLREGCDLVDYLLVGLPIFRLTVEAITLRRQDLPTIQEFILRSVQLGEVDAAGIANLLGLTESVIDEAIQTLLLDGLLSEVSSLGGMTGAFEVTDLGTERLVNGLTTPQDETLVFDYDGICRKPVRLVDEQIWAAKHLRTEGGLQIQPANAEPPDLSSLSLSDIGKVVRRISGKEFGKQILGLRRLLRSQMMFRPAVGLMFRNRSSQEFELAFVVEDALSEQHEIEFARNGGVKKPGFVRGNWDEDISRLKSWLGASLWSKISDEVAQQHQLRLQRAKREHADLLAQHERQRRSRKKLANVDLKSLAGAESDVSLLEGNLNSVELRFAAPNEQSEILSKAFEDPTALLKISTDDVDSTGVSRPTMGRIVDLVNSGVRVEIETDHPIEATPKGEAGSFEPTVELWSTAQMKRHLHLAKRDALLEGLSVLIQDRDVVMVTTRSLLKGRPKPLGFRPKPALLSKNPDIVASIGELLDKCNDRTGGTVVG